MIGALVLLALQATPPPIHRFEEPTPPPIRRFDEPKDDETEIFARVGPWTVAVDPSLANGCFLTSAYPDGTEIRLGFDARRGRDYLFLGNAAWQSLRADETYDLEIQLDNRPPWQTTAVGVTIGESVSLLTMVTDGGFVQAFGERQSMRVRWQGRLIAHLRLNGTAAAVRELGRCHRTYTRDPFASQ